MFFLMYCSGIAMENSCNIDEFIVNDVMFMMMIMMMMITKFIEWH